MKNKKTIKIILGATLLALFGYFAYYTVTKARRKESALNLKTMPDFKFYTLNDKAYTQADVPSGKPLLVLHFSTDCEHCQNEAKDLKKNISWFENVHILMVSDKSKEEINTFSQDYGLKEYPQIVFLRDTTSAFFYSFGTASFPLAYVYDSDHNLLKHFPGETGMDVIKKVLDQP